MLCFETGGPGGYSRHTRGGSSAQLPVLRIGAQALARRVVARNGGERASSLQAQGNPPQTTTAHPRCYRDALATTTSTTTSMATTMTTITTWLGGQFLRPTLALVESGLGYIRGPRMGEALPRVFLGPKSECVERAHERAELGLSELGVRRTSLPRTPFDAAEATIQGAQSAGRGVARTNPMHVKNPASTRPSPAQSRRVPPHLLISGTFLRPPSSPLGRTYSALAPQMDPNAIQGGVCPM